MLSSSVCWRWEGCMVYFLSLLAFSSSFRYVVGWTWYLVDYLAADKIGSLRRVSYPCITLFQTVVSSVSEHVTTALPLWRVLDFIKLPRSKQICHPSSASPDPHTHHPIITRLSSSPSRKPKEVRYGCSKHRDSPPIGRHADHPADGCIERAPCFPRDVRCKRESLVVWILAGSSWRR